MGGVESPVDLLPEAKLLVMLLLRMILRGLLLLHGWVLWVLVVIVNLLLLLSMIVLVHWRKWLLLLLWLLLQMFNGRQCIWILMIHLLMLLLQMLLAIMVHLLFMRHLLMLGRWRQQWWRHIGSWWRSAYHSDSDAN